MTYSTEVLLNDFAIRSFRDTADRDYVHARLAYRARLVPQFLWSSLHCLEKYAKGILLLNRVKATKPKHEVLPLLNRLNSHGRFKIGLSAEVKNFVARLDETATYRYFEVSYYNQEHDLLRLDRAVWELRRYCQPLDYSINTPSGPKEMLALNLEHVRRAATADSKDTCILSGWLEKTIKSKDSPAREPLLWKNLFFGPSTRKGVRILAFTEAGNSPLYMHPEILDEVLKYVFLQQSVIDGWRQELANRAQQAGES